jgi:glycosyltransferase involved in cell wall biosynthesis
VAVDEMKTPLVSITSAFYNTGPALLDMVRSIFAQTFSDWELILLDDGSTDNTLDIARSINDPRVRVYSNGKNIGRSASLNKITALARGRYIARMDSDDMCATTRLEKQVKLIESQSDIDVVGCGICYIDTSNRPLGHQYARTEHAEICKRPNRTFGLCHGAVLAKKSWYEKNHYDESISLAIDFNIWLRTYQQSKFSNVPDPLYFYRLSPSFNLRKQYIARRNSAMFLFEHFKNKGQPIQAAANWLLQYAKFGITLAMFLTGLRKKLMARRFTKLSENDIAFYRQEIEKIKKVKLPI